jgi:hypothetical protein
MKQFQAKGGFLLLPASVANTLNMAKAIKLKKVNALPSLKTYLVCMKEGRHPLLGEFIARLKSAFLHKA